MEHQSLLESLCRDENTSPGDFQVENSGRTVQYKLNSQSLRLFGLPSDVNDAHRASANRLQNKLNRCQIEVFLASRVLNTTDGIFCLFLQISVHRGHPESLNFRGHRSYDTVPLIVCSQSPLDW